MHPTSDVVIIIIVIYANLELQNKHYTMYMHAEK